MAIVEAGVSLNEFNALAKRQGQWLPLDSAGAADSTLGAIAATAASGALRLAFGTPRDYVIGLRLAHIDGTESKSGGRVAKNVAGYDLNKLYNILENEILPLGQQAILHLQNLPEESSFINNLSINTIGNQEELYFPNPTGSIELIHCSSCGYVAKKEVAQAIVIKVAEANRENHSKEKKWYRQIKSISEGVEWIVEVTE